MKTNITLKNIALFMRHHFTDQPYNFPKQDTDMNIVNLGLELDNYYKQLLAFQDNFEIKQLSTVTYKDCVYPIYEVNINGNENKKVLIIAGTHGNEQAGVFATLELLELFKNNPVEYKDLHIKIITPNNPVGIKYFSRFNGDGIDINRDFKKRRTVETNAVISVIEIFKPNFTVTLHEAPHEEGVFMYGNKIVEQNLAIAVLNRAKAADVKLASKGYFPGKFEIPGYFPLKGTAFFWIKLWSDLFNLQPEGYYTAINGIPNITIESSWQAESKEERVHAHIEIVRAILSEVKRL